MTAPSAETTFATWVADAFDVRWVMGTADHGRWTGPVQPKRTASQAHRLHCRTAHPARNETSHGDRARQVHPLEAGSDRDEPSRGSPVAPSPRGLVGHLG